MLKLMAGMVANFWLASCNVADRCCVHQQVHDVSESGMDCPAASGNYLLETASSSSKPLLNVLTLLLPICPVSASAFSVSTLPASSIVMQSMWAD